MKVKLVKVISALMATVIVSGIIFTGDIPQNNTVIQAVVSALGTIGTKNSNISGEAKHIEAKAEKSAVELKDILAKYDTGKPVSDKIKIKDDLKKVKDTYVISAKRFFKVTGDKYSFSSTGNGILIQHDGYSVALNPNDNMMVVNNDEYQYMPAPMTKVKNEYYFPVEDVAEGLGYSVSENKDELTLSRDYQSKRILVKTEEKLEDTRKAVATAEVIDDVYALQYDSETKAEDACEYFKSLKSVDYAQPDAIVTATSGETIATSEEAVATSAVSNDSSGTYYSWGAQAMGVDNYTDYLKNNVGESNLRDVVIAVLDTGIDTDHPWFSGRITSNGANFSSSVSSTAYSYEDVFGHGTHVSGIICDLTLDNVKILPVKVLNDGGRGYTSTIIQGINYVTQQKQMGQNIYAMNCSFGAAGAPTTDCNAYQTAITSAYNAGVLTVAAAGNDGIDASTTVPANTDCAITVAAVNQTASSYFRPDWSNYGACIDISAPGYDIESACVGGGTIKHSGTSMAAPHVAAAVALLYSNSLKSYSLSDIENTLDYFSIDLGNSGWDPYYGAGLVNLKYAYAASLSSVSFSNTTRECTEAFELSLSCPETGALIYYTLDGTSPSFSNGILYTGAIPIDTSVCIKAIAYILENNVIVKCSKISSMTYCLNGKDISNAFQVSNSGELISYTGIFTDLTVPSQVNNITVSSIGEYAFSSVRDSIVSVTLPSSVISINDNAFYGCSALTQVAAPSVTKIGISAFCSCTSFKYLQDLYFPELLTIGKNAFSCCSSLQSITLSKVTYIDDYAFCMTNINAPDLKEIALPSVKVIGLQAFYNCAYLTAIDIPSAVTICANAFRMCDITELSLPSAKYIGTYAFYENNSLTSANMPEAVIITEACFKNLIKLSNVNIPKTEEIYDDSFSGCISLKTLDISSATMIGPQAFMNCINLETINAPKLKYVDDKAFSNCVSLNEVYLPRVMEISKGAFSADTSLQKVTLSNNINDICTDAFSMTNTYVVFYLYGGTVAESFAISNGFKYVDLAHGSNCFQYKIINNSEVYITGYTDKLPENAEIPSYIEGFPVTEICADAFKNCTKVVTLSASRLNKIEASAFEGCSNLKEITMPNIDSIDEKAFYGCTSLHSVEITAVKTVGNLAFYGCSSLLVVELGNEISAIGLNAFGYNTEGLIIPDFAVYGFAGTAAETYALSHNIKFHQKYSPLSFFYYNFYQNNDHEEIYIAYVNKDVTGYITVPSSYNGYTISKVGDSAFQDCSFISGVELPESIKTIGTGAFSYCSSLETITCESVTTLQTDETIGAFEGCKYLKTIRLPMVKDITTFCFWGCQSLAYAYLPLAVSIGEGAFSTCSNLKKVVCPSLETISKNAFSSNYNLESIDLQNVKTIGYDAFDNCTSLKTIYLLNAVSIDSLAFNYCSSELTAYVHKESAAESIAKQIFLNCVEVESIVAAVNSTVIDKKNLLIYGLSPGIKSLDGYISSMPDAFKITYTETQNGFGTGTMVNIKLFDEIVSSYTIVIFGDLNGDGSIDTQDADTCVQFQNGESILSNSCYLKAGDLNGDGNIDSIDADIITDVTNRKISINQATGKETLTTPLSGDIAVTASGFPMFPSRDILKPSAGSAWFAAGNITAPTFTSGDYEYSILGSKAKITKYIGAGGAVTIPDKLNGYDVTIIGDFAFSTCTKITSLTMGSGVTTIGELAFNSCTKMASLNIGSNVTTIGYSAFESCSALTNIIIPDKVITIGESAFSNCSKLTGVTIGSSVKIIGDDAFIVCSTLASISIPDNVKTIGSSAFAGCSELKAVSIGSGVSTIGAFAFESCGSLTQIIIDSNNSSFSSQDNVLFDKTKTTLIECTSGVAGNYIIPDGVTTISDYAFYRCTKLTAITIPQSVTAIGYKAFLLCNAMNSYIVDSENKSFSSQDDILFNKSKTELIRCPYNKMGNYSIPNTVVKICDSAFSNCQALTGVEIPNSVTTINSGAFSGCIGLTSLTIPDSVMDIGYQAFSGCTGLKNLTMGNGLKSIEDFAFYRCTGLTNLSIQSVVSIGKSAFSCCSKLTQIILPSNLNSILDSAFSDCSALNSISFLGDAPALGATVFSNCYGGFKIYYISNKSGWSNSQWNNYQTALWKVTIAFNADGGYSSTSTLMPAGQALKPPTVSKPGYTFSGWSPIVPATVPLSSTTYTAQWTPYKQVAVTFDSNGGIGGTVTSTAWGASLSVPVVSRKGYTFTGWDPVVPSRVPAENVKYTAQWTYAGSADIKLEVGRYDNTDTFIPLNPNETLQVGDIITVRICPKNDFLTGASRYVVMFSKQYFSVLGSGKTAFTPNKNNPFYTASASDYSGTTAIAENLWPSTFGASENYNVYSAVAVNNQANSYSANGGFPAKLSGDWLFSFNLQVTQDVAASSNARICMDKRWVRDSGNPTGASYFAKCLDGQYSSQGDSVSYNYNVDLTNADIFLPLSENVVTGTINFDSAGGTVVAPMTGNVRNTVAAPAPPTKTGYTFVGWSPALPTNYPAGTLNVTAQWTVNSYKITFNANGGTGGTSCYMNYGDPLIPPAMTKTGCHIDGWQPELPSTVGEGDAYYTAQWALNTYSIAYYGNGNTGGTTRYSYHTYNKSGKLTYNGFTKIGYTFAGWSTSPDGNVMYMNAQSVYNLTDINGATISLYAKWMPITYTVTYNGNGSTSGYTANSSHTYDLSANLSINGFIKTGYSFLGWSTTLGATTASYSDGQSVVNLASSLSAIVPLYAVWSVNYYSVTFNANGGSGGQSTSIPYGSALSAPTVTRTGYIFAGWYSDSGLTTPVTWPCTLSAADVTFYAKWTLLGDINGDGGINVVDALMALHQVSGYRLLSDSQQPIADVDKNGVINIIDALKILQFSSGYITSFD